MFSKRNAAASAKPARRGAQKGVQKGASQGLQYVGSTPDKRAAKKAAKAAKKAAAQATGKIGKADRLAAARAAAVTVEGAAGKRFFNRKADTSNDRAWDKPVYAPGEEPSKWSVPEWSLRRKVALVLALPVIVAAAFGGLRINTERQLADNYAASASQVTVLGPAIDYLAAAQRAAATARMVGINDPKLEAAKREVVEAGAKLVEARDQADLTPAQLRQINDVISLSEQMRSGMAYVSITSMVSQVRQLERGITQTISAILDEQTRQEPALLTLAQALDGRLSLSLQEIQIGNDTVPASPVELYREFGVELASIDRLAISLGQTDARVLEIRQANAQRIANAAKPKGDVKVTPASYQSYDVLIDDLLQEIDDNLNSSARNAKVLTWADSLIIGLALLAAIILALLVSRLILNPIRKVRSGALEVAHERLPEAVARIRAGEDPGEIVPIGVTTHEETGQLARAVDDLHRQAVKLASNEAELRAQVGDMFVTLSRRNTSLINQQLSLIETLESDEEDPQRLESLFRLDHLASRMRRNAESLVILSGAPTRATEQDDLALTDVLQAAIAGVQDYKRVQLDAAPAQRVSGEAAPDVVHLLAELVDNALSYSPPSSRVLVTSSFTRGGVVVQVTDAGLGIAEDALGELNEKLRSGGEVNADTARRMGLFVVSRLSRRHGLTVQLDHNDRMGITATVFLPTSVLSDTARLESASGGAQVIELGASSSADEGYSETGRYDDEYAGNGFDDGRYERDADVAYLRPQAEPEEDPDPITAAINAYGLPQRRPGATGAGMAGAPVSMGGGFFDRVEPDEGLPGLPAPSDSADSVDSVDSVADHTEAETFEPLVSEFDVVEDEVTSEEREPIALGPVEDEVEETSEVEAAEDDSVDTDDVADVDETDGIDEAAAEAAELESDAEIDAEIDGVDEADEPEETAEAVAEADTEADEPKGAEGEVEADAGDVDTAAEVTGEVTAEESDEDSDGEPVDDSGDESGDDSEDEVLAPVATLPLPGTEPFEPPAAEHSNGNGNENGHGRNSNLAARLHSLAAAARNGSDAADAAVATNAPQVAPETGENGVPAGAEPAMPAAWAGLANAEQESVPGRPDGPLEEPWRMSAARTAASMDEDETPIFRSLRSNWLSADTGERPWADTEVDAGWDAAGRVEATPPTRRTETGLPMRRPGNRLIPGGLSAPAPVQTVRDPEAIRARLAAHAAGVSRGRNAASLTKPSSQEADPA